MKPLTEAEIFNKPLTCPEKLQPHVRKYIEEVIGWKRLTIKVMHERLESPDLPESEKRFGWMMTMKHFERALEELQRQLYVQELHMHGKTLEETEDEDDDEEAYYLKIAAEEVAERPLDITCRCVMKELRTYIGNLAAEVSAQHQYARRLAYSSA